MGLFTPIYMKGNLSVSQARAAISKVSRMTDQAKLASIARDGKERTVRTAAIDRLDDAALLVDLALNDKDVDLWAIHRLEKLRDAKALAQLLERHPKLEREYIERVMDNIVKDPAVLAHLAKTAAHDSVRVRAVERLQSQAVLADIALHNDVPWVRREAAWRLTDSEALAKIAMEDSDSLVRRAAIGNEHMTDGALLARLALKDRDEDVRKAAIGNKRLTDSHALAQYALSEPNKSNRFDALLYHTLDDEEDLKKLIRKTDDPNIRTHAVSQLRNPALLAEIALTSSDSSCRLHAVWNSCLSDQATLAKIAIQDDWINVGEACIKDRAGKDRITDPALLRRIATEAALPHTRQLAVQRLGPGDADLLEQIATHDADIDVRLAAVRNTALTDEDALFRIASAPDDAAYFDARVEAATKLSRRDADRAVAPLVALLKQRREEQGAFMIGACYGEAARFLMKHYANTADPEAKALIASLPDDPPVLASDIYHGNDRLVFSLSR